MNEDDSFASCRLPTYQRRLIDAAAALEGFATASDWIRDALRRRLHDVFGAGVTGAK